MSESEAITPVNRRGRWAKPVDRLSVPPLPKEAINLNVQGRRVTGPQKGFGQLWLRIYAVHLPASTVTPTELMRVWKERFGSFWPPGSHFYGSGRPIDAGDVAVLNLAGPAGTVISTGVYVTSPTRSLSA